MVPGQDVDCGMRKLDARGAHPPNRNSASRTSELRKRLEQVSEIPSVDHCIGARATRCNRQERLSRLEIEQLVLGECPDRRVAETRVEEIEAPADCFSIPKPWLRSLAGAEPRTVTIPTAQRHD